MAGITCDRQGKRGCGSGLSPRKSPDLAVRYRAGFITGKVVSSLPSPVRAAYCAAEAAYRGRDRGLVRSKNDRAMDHRANHFVKWLARMRFDYNTLQSLQEDHVMPLLISYLHYIAYEKGGLNKRTDLMAATLSGYLKAAVLWFKGYLHLTADIYLSPGVIHPMISDILAQRRAWQRPKKKREPYTYEMF
jgi:hypothetical protein